jgi:hypothetical protein
MVVWVGVMPYSNIGALARTSAQIGSNFWRSWKPNHPLVKNSTWIRTWSRLTILGYFNYVGNIHYKIYLGNGHDYYLVWYAIHISILVVTILVVTNRDVGLTRVY